MALGKLASAFINRNLTALLLKYRHIPQFLYNMKHTPIVYCNDKTLSILQDNIPYVHTPVEHLTHDSQHLCYIWKLSS